MLCFSSHSVHNGASRRRTECHFFLLLLAILQIYCKNYMAKTFCLRLVDEERKSSVIAEVVNSWRVDRKRSVSHVQPFNIVGIYPTYEQVAVESHFIANVQFRYIVFSLHVIMCLSRITIGFTYTVGQGVLSVSYSLSDNHAYLQRLYEVLKHFCRISYVKSVLPTLYEYA